MKARGQVAVTGETGVQRDGGDVLLRASELALGATQTLLDDVLRGRRAEGFAERDEQLMRGQSGEFGELGQADAFAEVLVDVFAQLPGDVRVKRWTAGSICGRRTGGHVFPAQVQRDGLAQRLGQHLRNIVGGPGRLL